MKIMKKFNALTLKEKCSILHDHGIFVATGKNGTSEYAIYSLDKAYDFTFAILFTNITRLGVVEITVLENWDVADFINVSLKNLYLKN
jgi:hypothetical protein